MKTGLSLRRAVLSALLLFVAAMLSLTGYTLSHLHQTAITSGLALAEAKSRSFEDYLTQSLQVTALAGAYLGPQDDKSRVADLNSMPPTLLNTLRQTPHLRSLSLLDISGRIVFSSNPANVGIAVNLNDFLPQVAGAQDVLRIGRPWAGRDFADGVPTTPSAPAAQGVQHLVPVLKTLSIDGKSYYLLAALNPDYFINHILQSFDGAQGNIEVLRFDGTLLMDSDLNARVGSAYTYVVRDLNLNEIETGEFEQDYGEHGQVLTGYRASRLYPFVVVTHFQRERALAQWRRESQTLLGVVIPTLLLVSLLAFWFYRRQVQHLALQALALRQQQISATVFDASAQAIIIADRNGDIVSVNAAFTRITGYSAPEVIGHNPRLLNSGVQSKGFYVELWNELFQNGVWHGELVNRHKDGRLYDTHLTLTVSRDSAGQVQHLIGVSSDITERKKLENSLKESEFRWKYAIEGAGDGLWDWNVPDGIVFFSLRWKEMLGYSADEVGTGFDEWEQRVHPDDKAASLKTVEDYLAGHSPTFSIEHRVLCKDGSYKWILARGMVVSRAPDGNPLRLIGTHSDITRLVTATKDAQAANIAKSRFLATMSHEIRTPMNGVLGMAQLLLMPNLSEAERRDYARTILSSGQTLLTLLNDILDLSKIEAGKFQLEPTVFEPDSVLHETGTLFSGAAQAKGLRLQHQWSGAPEQRYQADSHRLRQMLSNLVGNAIKFTHRGQVRIEAKELERDANSALLEFSVHDTGIGIPQDKQGLLFKPFSQTDNSTTREFGGSGLGLSIVRNLALAMGGDVGVESESGKGARFWFSVRAQVVTDGQDSRAAQRTAPTQAKLAPPPCELTGHVLVAEDNPINAMVIESLLRKLGLTMTLAKNGQQAVQAIAQDPANRQPFDLVLMDLQMPELDGYGATQRIRQWEADSIQPRLPIIALTADAFEENHRHCLAVGMDDFLTKPVSIDALKSTLSKWLPTTAPSAPTQSSDQAAGVSVDLQAFAALVRELTPLLAQNRFSAINRFKSLQAVVAGTDLADEINALDALLQEMRFDLVLERLTHIAASQEPA